MGHLADDLYHSQSVFRFQGHREQFSLCLRFDEPMSLRSQINVETLVGLMSARLLYAILTGILYSTCVRYASQTIITAIKKLMLILFSD